MINNSLGNAEMLNTLDQTYTTEGSETPELNLEYRSKITLYNETIPGRKTLVLMPGIVPNCERTYGNQIEELKELGTFNVVGLDYADKGFNIGELDQTLGDLVTEGDKLAVIATSFGTRALIDTLQRNPGLADRVSELILFGPFVELDRNKGTLAFLKAIRSRIPVSNLGPIEEPLVRIARNKFNYDPKFYKNPNDKDKMVNQMSINGLAGRMRYFSLPFNYDTIISTPTTIVWWDKEPASIHQRDKITNLFTNLKVANIPGRHGHLQTEAPAISDIIRSIPK